MADTTVTELASHPQATAHRPIVGVVAVYSRGPIVPRAYAIPTEATVGREGDIPVDDVGVSRTHARLSQRGQSLWVSDLGSRNGTFLNGAQVGPQGQLAQPGAVVRIGRTLLVVTADVTPYFGSRPGEIAGLLGGAALDDARICVETIAATMSSVLILGETGTGKEVVASAIHAHSGRPGPFVALNCAAVPSELVDAELFGHTRGAFSGATTARAGLFRAADGGTLFLDEIGDMPAPVQAKLLRTLETREVRAVGEDRATAVDVRVLAATHRNVDGLVETGAFRGDLLHRLAGLRITLPALRQRSEDVPLLAEHFLQGAGVGLSVLALERLLLHGWPGNVRELRNVVIAALEIARRKGHVEIEITDLPAMSQAQGPVSTRPGVSEHDAQAAQIAQALTASNGDVGAAARELSMSRSSLYETLRRLGIDPRAYRRR